MVNMFCSEFCGDPSASAADSEVGDISGLFNSEAIQDFYLYLRISADSEPASSSSLSASAISRTSETTTSSSPSSLPPSLLIPLQSTISMQLSPTPLSPPLPSSSASDTIESKKLTPAELLSKPVNEEVIKDIVSKYLFDDMVICDSVHYRSQEIENCCISEYCIKIHSYETDVDDAISSYENLLKCDINDLNIKILDSLCHSCPIPLFISAIRDLSFQSHQVDEVTDCFKLEGLSILTDVFTNSFTVDYDIISDRVNMHIKNLLSKMEALSPNTAVRFKEIMKRGEGRFDASLDDDIFANTCLSLQSFKTNEWFKIISSILTNSNSLPSSSMLSSAQERPSPTIIKRGVVFALPGARKQYLHADADPDVLPCSALCMFIPLIDLTESTGYTSFWPGSQMSHQADLLQHNVTDIMEQSNKGHMIKGLLRKKEVLLYDYKTIHRGEANYSSILRPVVYLIFALEGFNESYNFMSNSIDDFI